MRAALGTDTHQDEGMLHLMFKEAPPHQGPYH